MRQLNKYLINQPHIKRKSQLNKYLVNQPHIKRKSKKNQGKANLPTKKKLERKAKKKKKQTLKKKESKNYFFQKIMLKTKATLRQWEIYLQRIATFVCLFGARSKSKLNFKK